MERVREIKAQELEPALSEARCRRNDLAPAVARPARRALPRARGQMVSPRGVKAHAPRQRLPACPSTRALPMSPNRPVCARRSFTAPWTARTTSWRPSAAAPLSSTTITMAGSTSSCSCGTRFEGAPPEATNRLYKNNRDGTFTDVTEKAGLRRTGWASAVAVGDLRQRRLRRSLPHLLGPERALPQQRRRHLHRCHRRRPGCCDSGTLGGPGCTFIDYDRDGRLDLFVANYLEFDLAKPRRSRASRRPATGRACP